MKHSVQRLLIVLAMPAIVLVTSTVWATPFDHDDHLSVLEGESCLTCHVEDGKSISPDQAMCLQCHEAEMLAEVTYPGLKTHGASWALSHRAIAKNQTIDCASCHQQSDCLECHSAGLGDEMGQFSNNMSNVHRSDFHVSHPIAARTNPQLCSS